MQRIARIITIILALPAAVFAASIDVHPNFLNSAEKRQFWESLEVFYNCSSQSETGVLRGSDMEFCMLHYLKVKLSFMESLDDSTFSKLSAKQRALANRISYNKFKQWEEENPHLVKQIRENAELRPHPMNKLSELLPHFAQ